MDILHTVLHLDESLVIWSQSYGTWMYAILFLVIFAETGLVIAPFLPGDSLLFAAGAVCALDGSALSIAFVWVTLVIAAVAGDNVNYWIGREFGARWIQTKRIPLNERYLHEAEEYYRKYGLRTVVLARFIPIVRTFAPFAAGLGKMNYRKYLMMSVLGSILWMSLFLGAGFRFGNISQVKTNFHFVILGVVAISFLPIIIKFVRSRLSAKSKD